MTDDREIIKDTLKQMESIYRSISVLLSNVDESVSKLGWKAYRNKTYYISHDLSTPEEWFPKATFRFFTNKKFRNLLAYVSVILDESQDERCVVDEPLATAGFFVFAHKLTSADWYYEYSRWHTYLHNSPRDGTIVRLSKSNKNWPKPVAYDGEEEQEFKFQSAISFAQPLLSLQNSSDVEAKITRQLTRLLKEVTQGRGLKS